MTMAELQEKVCSILAENLSVPEGQVTPQARFQEDLDADSLDLVEAVLALEEEFGVTIPEEEMEGIKTVGEAVDLVASRVVVTGIGPVTPVGLGADAFWDALTAGRSGVARIERFDPSALPVQIAGEVKDFTPTDWMGGKEAKRTDRVTHFAMAAAKLAWADAGEPASDPGRTGIVIST